jgi:hypothetical protein
MKIPMKFLSIITSTMVLLPASLGMAQQTTPQSSPSPQMQGTPEMGQMQGMEGMQKMDKMADSVTKMSDMCQMMMQKEMTGMYYKVAAGVAIATLLFLALLLLVILEIQWIMYWARLLREQKRS